MAQDPHAGKSLCVKSDGTEVWIDDIVIPANLVYNFVEMYRKDYFENHSLEYAVVDCIIPRGKAEIIRAVKATDKREKDAAAGKAVKELNLTPAQMVAEFLRLKALEAAQADAKAKK